MVRMAYLAIVGSHKVNGVAELHSDLIKTTIFKDFVKIFGPDKFTNVTNGITPRRWLHQANPRLSELIASKTGGLGFLKDLNILNELEKFVDDKEFKKEWAEIKYANKVRLTKHIKTTTGVTVNPAALFDIQVKRIHEYKRQQMNIFGVIHRYLTIKAMTHEERKKLAPRVSIFGGKAAPGYWMAKTIIHLINSVGAVVNNDKDVGDLLKVIFLEDYNVSKAETIIPASDISEHISTAGTEASGTSNMKFVLNGGLIIGTCDGANVSCYPSNFCDIFTNLSRSKSPVKLERTTSFCSETWLKMSKIFAILTTMAPMNLIQTSQMSLRRSRRGHSGMPVALELLLELSRITATTTSSQMTSTVTLRLKASWMLRTRIKMNGLRSAS